MPTSSRVWASAAPDPCRRSMASTTPAGTARGARTSTSPPRSVFASRASVSFSSTARLPTLTRDSTPSATQTSTVRTWRQPARVSRAAIASAKRITSQVADGGWLFRPDDAAVAQRDPPVGVRGECRVVRDEHERAAPLAVECEEELDDRGTRRRVEVARRLVGEQQRRCPRDRARQRHALLLTARELHGIVMTALAESDLVQQGERARAHVRRTGELEGDRDVLGGGERRDQVVRLEDEADAVAPEPRERVFAEPRQAHAIDRNRTARRCIEAGDEPEQRRLAAARRPGDRHALAARDVEAHAVEDGDHAPTAREAHHDVVH